MDKSDKNFLSTLIIRRQGELNRRQFRNAVDNRTTRDDLVVQISREDYRRMIDLSIEALRNRLGE